MYVLFIWDNKAPIGANLKKKKKKINFKLLLECERTIHAFAYSFLLSAGVSLIMFVCLFLYCLLEFLSCLTFTISICCFYRLFSLPIYLFMSYCLFFHSVCQWVSQSVSQPCLYAYLVYLSVLSFCPSCISVCICFLSICFFVNLISIQRNLICFKSTTLLLFLYESA